MSEATHPPQKPKCFIAMPVSTPDHLSKEYGDPDHFKHVMEELFLPAIEAAGMIAVPPISTGSEVIHADIIEALQSAELVLVDLSSLNPNVLFEFGVRTSLNKPAGPIRDDKTPQIPFDTSTLNTHTYSSDLQSWITKLEIPKLTSHLQASLEKSKGQNALWKHFGFKQAAEAPREPKGPDEKLDALMNELAGLRTQVERIEKNSRIVRPNPVENARKRILLREMAEDFGLYFKDVTWGENRVLASIEEPTDDGVVEAFVEKCKALGINVGIVRGTDRPKDISLF